MSKLHKTRIDSKFMLQSHGRWACMVDERLGKIRFEKKSENMKTYLRRIKHATLFKTRLNGTAIH